MADSIIKHLNSRLADKISNTKPAGSQAPGGSGMSKFDQVLTSKLDNSVNPMPINNPSNQNMFEKLGEAFVDDKGLSGKMEAYSADDIQINIANNEFGAQSGFDAKNAISDLFSTINNDSLKMDSIIEVLSSSDTKLNRRQLLAYQASIGSLAINTELFSKLAQSLSQNLNTLLQTNMG